MDFIYGLRPVEEAIKNGYNFKKIYLQKKLQNESFVQTCVDYCKSKKIQFFFLDKEQLDDLIKEKSHGANHQGFVAELKGGEQKLSDLRAFLKKTEGKSLILILDQVTDVQNMATIIRTAVFFGCKLIVLENTNAAPINETVHRVSSGSSLLIPFYFCDKLSQAISILQEEDFGIYSASSSQPLPHQDENTEKELHDPSEHLVENTEFKDKTAILLGSEHRGIRPHLLRQVDKTISIFNNNYFDSLNVAVANGILLHEVSKKLY